MKYIIDEIFSKFMWDESFKGKTQNIRLKFIHRGAKDDSITIPFDEILRKEGHYFILSHEIYGETYIPFHRILTIWDMSTGEIFYKKADN